MASTPNQKHAREILAEMSKALAPAVEKYKSEMSNGIREQLEEGLITEYEALSHVIDKLLDE
jgi:BMFP domain-containing protein YqiC